MNNFVAITTLALRLLGRAELLCSALVLRAGGGTRI
jgi:hypothetical protein